jgi:hypothetical protein
VKNRYKIASYNPADLRLMTTNNDNKSIQGQAAKNKHNTRPASPAQPAKEIGGPKGPEPTRYGDWEKNGRCNDF